MGGMGSYGDESVLDRTLQLFISVSSRSPNFLVVSTTCPPRLWKCDLIVSHATGSKWVKHSNKRLSLWKMRLNSERTWSSDSNPSTVSGGNCCSGVLVLRRLVLWVAVLAVLVGWSDAVFSQMCAFMALVLIGVTQKLHRGQWNSPSSPLVALRRVPSGSDMPVLACIWWTSVLWSRKAEEVSKCS